MNLIYRREESAIAQALGMCLHPGINCLTPLVIYSPDAIPSSSNAVLLVLRYSSVLPPARSAAPAAAVLCVQIT